MKKNRSVLWMWALSYLGLLFIPFISIFVNYYTNEKTLTKKLINSYELTVSNLRDNVDNLIFQSKNFYYYVLNNESFGIMQLSTTKDGSYYNTSYQLHNSLKFYCSANPKLDCTIYNIGLSHVSSPEKSIGVEEYYQSLIIVQEDFSTYPQWNLMMSAHYSDEFLISNAISSKTSTPCLVYANTLTRGTFYPINIFISVPISEIKQITQYLPDDTCLLLEIDEQLYEFNNTDFIDSTGIASLSEDNGLIPSSGYLTVSSSSRESSLTYHLVITRAAIDSALQNTRKNFILNLCITLLLGFVGISFLLYRNYQPISNLMKTFDVKTSKNNEFQSIAATYEKLQTDYHNVHLTLQTQNQKFLNSWLLSLLKGRINQSDILKAHNHFQISPDSSVALIGFVVPFSDHQSMEYDDLLFFVINNIFQELFHDKSFYHIEDGRFIYYLFDLKESEPNELEYWHDYALEKLNYLCSFLNEKWNTNIIGVVSEPAENLSHCKFLYRKVMETFELASLTDNCSVTDTRSLTNHKFSDYKELINQELNTALLKGELQAALNVSNRIFSANSKLPFATQKIYIFDAFTVVMDLISHYGTDDSKKLNILNYVTQLIQTTSREELKNIFEHMLTEVCQEISHEQQTEGNKLILNIRQYIESHYKEQTLSVSSMADALNRNPKYISRIFKEVTGIGILDYISHIRITKAKEIMLEKRYSLEEISEIVGYANVRAFRRAFVKITGDIPSKFTPK